MVGVKHFHTHHLVTAADAQHGSTLAVSPHDGLGTAVATQLIQVVQGGFCTRQDDDVGFLDILGIVGVEQMYPRVSFQGVKIGVIG